MESVVLQLARKVIALSTSEIKQMQLAREKMLLLRQGSSFRVGNESTVALAGWNSGVGTSTSGKERSSTLSGKRG